MYRKTFPSYKKISGDGENTYFPTRDMLAWKKKKNFSPTPFKPLFSSPALYKQSFWMGFKFWSLCLLIYSSGWTDMFTFSWSCVGTLKNGVFMYSDYLYGALLIESCFVPLILFQWRGFFHFIYFNRRFFFRGDISC